MPRKSGWNVVRLSFVVGGCAVTALAASAIAQTQATSAPAAAAAPVVSAAAAAGAASAAPDAARIAAGRDLFGNWGCSACHTLADAKSNGAVGPMLDGDTSLSEQFITARVTNGQGAMPAFGGQLSEKEIADLAYYIVHVRK